jgi:SAM-dependent MidA family methyltransferase
MVSRAVGSPPSRRTPLTEILVDRIRRQGPLTFAQFMEACLYHPQHGYYTRPAHTKGAGDYFTSADVGPLFGRLLLRQFQEMWSILGQPERFDLVECGAGRGRLAGPILQATRQWPEFAGCLRMTLVEASESRMKQAQEALRGVGATVRVQAEIPAGVMGCIFSNELLDALPVHRVVQRAEGLREVYVSQRDGELVEEEGEVSSPAIAGYLERYGSPLAEGQLAEVNLAALGWLEQVAATLERGFLLTIDYGYRAPELYGPGHQRGTVLAYRRHRTHEEWLSWPGEQDLTAHVNFTALEERGRELGLKPVGWTTQTNFLLALARVGDFADLGATDACDFDQMAVRLAFKQLIHPEGMGETFRVLVQAKSVDEAELSGLKPL